MVLKKGFTNIVILIVILTNFLGVAFGTDIIPPMWTDFCPAGLENAEYKEIKWFLPDGSKSTQEIYNYWANRRKEFQATLVKCGALNYIGQRECYAELKRNQLFYNEQYKRGIYQQQITRQDWRDNHEKGSSPVMIHIFRK